jgi:CheY-like chemotaxis protein
VLGLLRGAGLDAIVMHAASSPDAPDRALAHSGPAGGHQRWMQPHRDPNQPPAPPRVLLVDDSAAMRGVLRDLLEDAGLVVVGEAADGLEGVAQAEALDPDVVLMDWRMPRLDGIGATRRIRQRLPHIQVVMFTHAQSEGAEVARQAGAAAFLPKGTAAELVCAAVLAAWRRSTPPGSDR